MLDGVACVPFFVGAPLTLEAALPHAVQLATSGLGRLIYYRRHELGLSTREAGKRIGVIGDSVRKWEKGRVPNPKYMPAIIAFLGTDEWIPKDTFPDRLKWFRMQLGLTQREAADALGCAKKTVYKWETGQVLSPGLKQKIERKLTRVLGPEMQKRSA